MPTVSVVELDASGQEMAGSEKKFQVDIGDIIYDALDNNGHKLPHGCLAGSCGSCRILVLEGAENLAGLSVVEDNTVQNLQQDYTKRKGADFVKGKVFRLSCRARVSGDIKIAPLKD